MEQLPGIEILVDSEGPCDVCTCKDKQDFAEMAQMYMAGVKRFKLCRKHFEELVGADLDKIKREATDSDKKVH